MAFFNIGLAEVLILAALGALFLVLVVIVVGVALAAGRRKQREMPDALAALRRENAELRDEIEQLRSEMRSPEPPENPAGIRKPQ